MTVAADFYRGVPQASGQPDMFDTPPVEVPDEVAELYEKLTFEVIAAGFDRYSSDAILHRIRWHMHVEKGNREFKCNDHWTAGLARWFMRKYPRHDGFFETRERRAKAAADPRIVD